MTDINTSENIMMSMSDSYKLHDITDNIPVFNNEHIKYNTDNILFKTYKKVNNELVKNDVFERNFDITTKNLFLCMDWNNMIVAGGSVLALKTLSEINDNDFNDFDIFLYGLNDRSYNKKVIEIYNSFKQICNDDIVCVRTKRTITFVIQGQRHIQIIIKKYDDIQDILSGFDIDCCAIAYTGSRIIATERCINAINTNINTVDLTLSSASYEYRLSKYAKRGYAVYVENYQPQKIDYRIYTKNVKYQTGLAKLLVLEKLGTNTKYQLYNDTMDYFLATQRRNLNLKADYASSEYDSVFMPDWTKKLNKNNITTECNKINAEYNCRMFYIRNINDIIIGPVDIIKTDINISKSDVNVNGRIEWVNDDTDTDMIFTKKITDINMINEWHNSAYGTIGIISDIIECVRKFDHETLKSLVTKDNVNNRDIINHTPLHEAIIFNNMEAVKFFDEIGADFTFVSRLKKTPLHTAYEQNNMDMVKYILDKDKSFAKIKDSYNLLPYHYAIVYGYFDLFKYSYEKRLIKKIVWSCGNGGGSNLNGLEMCLYYKRYDIAQFLLDNGYDINDHKNDILVKSICYNDEKFFSLLIDNNVNYDLNYDNEDISNRLLSIITRAHESDVPRYQYLILIDTIIEKINFCKKHYNKFIMMVIEKYPYDMIIEYFTEYRPNTDLLNRKKIMDFLNDKMTEEKVSETETLYNYTYQFAPIISNDIVFIPQWIVESEARFKKSSNCINLMTDKKFVTQDIKHWQNIKQLILKIFNHEFNSNNVNAELDDDIIECGEVINTKHTYIDSDSDDERVFEKEINIKNVKINIDNSSTKFKYEHFRLFDEIHNKKTLTIGLEDLDLDVTLTRSKMTALDIAQYSDNKEIYFEIIDLMYNQMTKDEEHKYITRKNIRNAILNVTDYYNDLYEKIAKEYDINKENNTVDYVVKDLIKKHSKTLKLLCARNTSYEKITGYVAMMNKLNGSREYDDFNINQLLLEAFTNKNFNVFQVLIDYVNSNNVFITLIKSMQHYDIDCTEYMDIIMEYVDKTQNYLQYVTEIKSNHVFNYLIKIEQSLETTENYNALHLAIINKHYDMCEQIIERFPDEINTCSKDFEYTPLMIAINKYDSKIIKLLLNHDVDQTKINKFGQTALHIAIMCINSFVVPLLTVHNNENYFKMTPNDYLVNYMKSYYHHARSSTIPKYKLAFVSDIYTNFKINDMERIMVSDENVNKTNKLILDVIDDNKTIKDLII